MVNLKTEIGLFTVTVKIFVLFLCRLFAYTEPCNRSTPSYLAAVNGCGPSSKRKRLFDRIPNHENSTNHKRCYLEWRQLEIRLLHDSTIDMQLNANITP